MQAMVIMQPRTVRTSGQLEAIKNRMDYHRGSAIPAVRVTSAGLIEPVRLDRRRLIGGTLRSQSVLSAISNRIFRARRSSEESDSTHARIVAIVPTFEREDEIDKTIESLLLQTRPIDMIVVIINGPGESDEAYQLLLPLIEIFSDQLKVERPAMLNGRHVNGLTKGGKVGALNYAYSRYLHHGDFDFMLGLDADVEADQEMVQHLETDLLRRNKAGGVMARYSFKIPKHVDMKGKSLSLIHGQRHEFAATGIKHQLRSNTSEILGGQATLFRIEALRKAAFETEGGAPWDTESLVEDAQLTRTLEQLGYTPATSVKARAWTGLMFNAHALQKQRRKWQDGHLTDMVRDFHPWLDRRRWREQLALGWNLLLRVMFAVVLVSSIALDKFDFNPVWLLPVGLAILQSVLIALKVPNRTFGEVLRAFLFIPGEIYYVRTLSVWFDSVLLALVNIRRDGWGNQALAESARKKTAFSGWIIIGLAVAAPMAILLFAARFLPNDVMSTVITYCWYTVTVLTLGSVIGMVWFILRMIRNFRTLAP